MIQLDNWDRIRLFVREKEFSSKGFLQSVVAANFSLRLASVEWIRFTQAEACGYTALNFADISTISCRQQFPEGLNDG